MIKYHEISPVYNKESKILILGSFPSIKSREIGFYYMHPTNRFWKVLSLVYQEQIIDKKSFLLNHHLALWDVIASCEITASADSSIKNIQINDIPLLLKKTKIKHIFTTGKKAYELYQKYLYPLTNIEAISLPSTSSANASYSLDRLVIEYSKLKDLKE